jgi:signal transduction histidine kinase
MGLWTVKHIVDKHGGKIHVQSEPGKGATFIIEWPRSVNASTPHSRFTKRLRTVTA